MGTLNLNLEKPPFNPPQTLKLLLQKRCTYKQNEKNKKKTHDNIFTKTQTMGGNSKWT
jgi:hypothetical protein